MSRIPIANVYYLLCYAWRQFEEAEAVEVTELDRLERVQDLLGKVLAAGVFRLVRRGLDRGYREVQEDLPGLRGKLVLGEMAKRALRARGRTCCVLEELSHDILHNRLLRSTLRDLLRVTDLDPVVRGEVRTAFQKLDGVGLAEVGPRAFRRVQLDRNRRLYFFLLALCELVHDLLLIAKGKGTSQFPDFREDEHRMWRIFEAFVQEFFVREQDEYIVNRNGRRIVWSDAAGATAEDERAIPRMEADVLLDSPRRRIVLDAKFYERSLTSHRGSEKLRSGSVYQLLAYLRNRQTTQPDGPRHEGILLYPVVDRPPAVDVRLEGFRIQARGIDLSQDWKTIHRDMLAVVGLV